MTKTTEYQKVDDTGLAKHILKMGNKQELQFVLRNINTALFRSQH